MTERRSASIFVHVPGEIASSVIAFSSFAAHSAIRSSVVFGIPESLLQQGEKIHTSGGSR